jgi:hypothetical protein
MNSNSIWFRAYLTTTTFLTFSEISNTRRHACIYTIANTATPIAASK